MYVICIFIRLQKEKNSEFVQFMQFDSEGNLFVFEPGCGCSGVPRKVSQGLTQDEMMSVFDNQNYDKSTTFGQLSQKDVYKLVPKPGASAMIGTNSRRFESFMNYYIFCMLSLLHFF